MYSAYIVIF